MDALVGGEVKGTFSRSPGFGFAPADDNEADALALLHWAIAQGIGGAQ